MNLSAILQTLYPGIVVGVAGEGDCEIVKGEDGVTRISAWRRPEPQPTDAEIAAAALPAAKAAKRTDIKTAARAQILARYPEWQQANLTARAVELVSLGQTTGQEWARMQAIWDWIKATRARSDLLEADVDNCTTVEAVEQLTIGGWPE
jgi:hypothetical protein